MGSGEDGSEVYEVGCASATVVRTGAQGDDCSTIGVAHHDQRTFAFLDGRGNSAVASSARDVNGSSLCVLTFLAASSGMNGPNTRLRERSHARIERGPIH